MDSYSTIRDLVEATPFIDTHEHLIEESRRLTGEPGHWLFPCDDWAMLFSHYLDSDLLSAGMPLRDRERFLSPGVPVEEKHRLMAPWWERTRHTGYAQAVRHTIKGLYGIGDLTAETVHELDERYRELVRPGFYRHVIQVKSNVEHCQVNSLERTFMVTEQPELLRQDLSLVPLSSGFDPARIEQESGWTAETLDEWLEVIDRHFREYGSRAVAVKSQSAYQRRLNYGPVSREQAGPIFDRAIRGDALSPEEIKPLQDYLFRYCLGRATEYDLPVKLHTGYYAGSARMPLERVRLNAGDLCPLLMDFPETRFILMHVGWPYQDEFIALAKHFPNVTIDLCWAWIINPAAGVRFVREFLMAAPANKLLTFGGDYIPVEPVYGHSRIARLGLARALAGLVDEGWMAAEDAPELVKQLMHGNARELFPEPVG